MFVNKLKAVLRPIEAQATLQELHVEASNISGRMSRLRAERVALKQDIEHRERKLEHWREGERGEYILTGNGALSDYDLNAQSREGMQQRVAEHKQRLSEVERDLASAEKEHAEALRQIKKLQASQNQAVSVTSRDLNAHVKAITAAAAEVERIQRLIDRQQDIIQGGTDSDLQTALNERQTVLADLAEDKASNADLAAIDKRIDQIRADMAQQQQQASIAQDTINGLQPRLAGAEAKHASLTEQYTHLRAHCLMSQMDDVSQRYNEAATALMQCYTEYSALHETLEALPGYKSKRGLNTAPEIGTADGSSDLPGFDDALYQKLLSSIARRVPML